MNRPKAIVCDIDGCLLDVSKIYLEIHKLGLKGQEMWDYFHENANNPEYAVKIPEMFNLLNMYEQNGYKIIILTARRDLIGPSTLHYLLEGDIKLNNISIMVHRPKHKEGILSNIYKAEEIRKLEKFYDIQLVIDDEYTNCATFKEMGFTVLRVLRNEEA